MCDYIASFHARHNGALLDGRRFLETVCVNTAEELLTQTHLVEVVIRLAIVRLDDAVWVHAGGSIVRLLLAVVIHLRCDEVVIIGNEKDKKLLVIRLNKFLLTMLPLSY